MKKILLFILLLLTSSDSYGTTGISALGSLQTLILSTFLVIIIILGLGFGRLVNSINIYTRSNITIKNYLYATPAIIYILLSYYFWISDNTLNWYTFSTTLLSLFLIIIILYRFCIFEKYKILSYLLFLIAALLIVLNPKVIDLNKYVLIDNIPFSSYKTVIELNDQDFIGENMQEFYQLDDGSIISVNNKYYAIAVGDRVQIDELKMFSSIYTADEIIKKALINIPIFEKEINANSKRRMSYSLIKNSQGKVPNNVLNTLLCSKSANYPRIKILHMLLKQGANPNHVEYNNTTCFYHLLRSNNSEMVKLFFAYSADPNYSGLSTNSIHEVIRNENTDDLMKLLLQNGADPSFIEPYQGNTPLHILSTGYHGHHNTYEKVLILLDAGADISRKNKKGETPLDRSINVLESYYKNNPNIDKDKLSTPEHRKIIKLLTERENNNYMPSDSIVPRR